MSARKVFSCDSCGKEVQSSRFLDMPRFKKVSFGVSEGMPWVERTPRWTHADLCLECMPKWEALRAALRELLPHKGEQ